MKKKKLIFAVIFSLLLCVTNYFMNNIPLFSGLDLNRLFVMKAANNLIHRPNECNDLLFINTAHDMQTADKCGIIEGKIDSNYNAKIAVADRRKLTEVLKLLENVKYKYLILDIEFSADTKTEFDSALYAQISQMDNIVIGYDKDNPLDPRVLLNSEGVPDSSRIALANYFATVTATNFVKYKYSADGKRFIPLRVYEAENPKDSIKQWGLPFLPIYTSGNSLCWNSVVLKFDGDLRLGHKTSTTKGKLTCSNYNVAFLGSEILDEPDYNLEEDATDKYIIIANYEDDMHDTYCGMQSGGVILYEALKALQYGRHKLSPLYFIVWFLVYVAIYLFITSSFRFSRLLNRNARNKHRLLTFLLNLVGVTAIIYLCQVVEFSLTQTLSGILLPGLAFYVLQMCHDYKQYVRI